MTLASETAAYQTMLEGHRLDPDNDELYVDLLKAKDAMEIAWLNARPHGLSLFSAAKSNDTTYEQLLERGHTPQEAGATYEWECVNCRTRTWRSAAGGTVDCVCEDKSNQDMRIHRMFAGQREDLGLASELAESKRAA